MLRHALRNQLAQLAQAEHRGLQLLYQCENNFEGIVGHR
jgi:hypothetical protein